MSNHIKQYAIVGVTSSGKTTLAKKLAEVINGDFIDLDSLHWEPNWVEANDEVFRERTQEATQKDSWVVAGNYKQVRDIVWAKAEAVIWLDYSFPLVFWRLISRIIYRSTTKEKLFSGNQEQFWRHMKLWSDESLINWLFKSYWRIKHNYPNFFAMPEYSHLQVFRFKTPRQVASWLKKLGN
jgi:adenylate kinase family enzyme